MKVVTTIIVLIVLFIQILGAYAENQIFYKNKDFLEGEIQKNKMGHQWALYGHDEQNTCQSDFSANDNPGHEKWKFFIDAPLFLSTPVIDGDGVLYITSSSNGLYAVYPNGTLKWHQNLIGFQEYSPCIGIDGTIYAGTNERFHAFYPNGTLRWILPVEKEFTSKPVVDSNGTIYVGTYDGYIYAIYPNGTIKWEFNLGYLIDAISIDTNGNIYIAAYLCDYLFSLYPDGTLRWTFEIVQDITDAPLIGPDGTLYIVPVYDVVAIAPNGTEKWRVEFNGAGGSPALAPDGTIIYSPYSKSYIYKLDPSNGNVLWEHQLEITSRHKTRPAIANDGMIFFAYTDLVEDKAFLSALDPDGTLRWTTRLTSDICPFDYVLTSANPSIGADGTIYITSWFGRGGSNYTDFGYIHAFGECDPNAPDAPTITGTAQGKTGVPYEFTFQVKSPLDNDVYYLVDWGDSNGETEMWAGPYHSNETVTLSHTWFASGVYAICAVAKDSSNLQGPWSGTFTTIMATKLLLLGFIHNLSIIGQTMYTFNAKAIISIKANPPDITFHRSDERILIYNDEYSGFLTKKIILGKFYTIIPSIKQMFPI